MVFFDESESIFGLLVSGVTPVAAIVAGILAWLSYRMNRAAALATRFQKGAEMIASTDPTVGAAGAAVLSDVVLADPKIYLIPVLKTLRGAVYSHHRDYTDPLFVRMLEKSKAPLPPLPPPSSNSAIAVEEITIIGRRIPGWPKALTQDGRLTVRRFLLRQYAEEAVHYKDVFFRGCVLLDTDFVYCTFDNCHFSGVFSNVRFDRCTFRNTSIEVLHPDDGRLIAQPDLKSHISVSDCVLDNLTINGKDFGRSPPPRHKGIQFSAPA